MITNFVTSRYLYLEQVDWVTCKVGSIAWLTVQTCFACVTSCSLPEQDNLWKYALNDRINKAAMRAFDMAFIIGQKSYDGYEYYDFFEQVFEKLKGDPFRSNLTSEKEASTLKLKERGVWMCWNACPQSFNFSSCISDKPLLCLSARCCASLCYGTEGSLKRRQRPPQWKGAPKKAEE